MPAKKTRSTSANPIVIILFVFVLLFVAAGTYLYMQRTQIAKTTATKNVLPTATPRPIPHGKIGFGVGGSKPNAPTFGRGFLNPYDPAKGAKQTISIEVNDKTAVLEVTGTLKTDTKQQHLIFSLVEGTAQKGRWETTLSVQDAYLYTYELQILAKNKLTSDQVEIMLR